MSTSFLDQATYEKVVVAGLQHEGLTEAQARALCAARWPLMGCGGILSEAMGRGLALHQTDLEDWLATLDDLPEGLTTASLMLTNGPLESFLAWAVENGRGERTPCGFAAENPEIIDAAFRQAATQWN